LNISLNGILETVREAVLNGSSATLAFYGTVLLPQVLVCLALLFLGRYMNARLWKTFDWRGVMFLAWLGTPVHEISHLIGCVVGRNRIEGFAIFSPDKESGSLGYVTHSYERSSLYQRVFGNTLVALAPFFGGAAAIYFLTHLAYPQLLREFGAAPALEWRTFVSLGALSDFASGWKSTALHFYYFLTDARNLHDGWFWVYLWGMISLGAHLSPSRSDFEGFWGAALLLLCLPFIVFISLAFFGNRGEEILSHLSVLAAQVNMLLLMALFFTFMGALFVTAVTLLASVFKKVLYS